MQTYLVARDAGYWSKANTQLADEQTELFIATTKDWKRRKELQEANPPRGGIPEWYGLKERMGSIESPQGDGIRGLTRRLML